MVWRKQGFVSSIMQMKNGGWWNGLAPFKVQNANDLAATLKASKFQEVVSQLAWKFESTWVNHVRGRPPFMTSWLHFSFLDVNDHIWAISVHNVLNNTDIQNWLNSLVPQMWPLSPCQIIGTTPSCPKLFRIKPNPCLKPIHIGLKTPPLVMAKKINNEHQTYMAWGKKRVLK